MATKAETRDRAAEILGMLQVGQALENQDDVRISAAYDEVYADLKSEGIATWAATGAVPDELVPHVAALTALNCTETYSISAARMNRIVAKTGTDGNLAKREIRMLVTPRYESAREPRDF